MGVITLKGHCFPTPSIHHPLMPFFFLVSASSCPFQFICCPTPNLLTHLSMPPLLPSLSFPNPVGVSCSGHKKRAAHCHQPTRTRSTQTRHGRLFSLERLLSFISEALGGALTKSQRNQRADKADSAGLLFAPPPLSLPMSFLSPSRSERMVTFKMASSARLG